MNNCWRSIIRFSTVLLLSQSLTSRAQEPPMRHRPLSPAQQKHANARLIALWTDKKGEASDAKSDTMTPQAVQQALSQGANVNARNSQGETTLIVASGAGYYSGTGEVAVVKLLLDRGVDVNVRDKDGWTALMAGVSANHLAVVKLLLDHGADANAGLIILDGETPLRAAAMVSQAAIVKLLLDHGADVNAKDRDGQTALMTVVELRNIRHLRKAQSVTAKRDVAEIESAVKDDCDVITLLLAHGADMNAKDMQGDTALMDAVNSPGPSTAVVQFLLDHEADVNARDKKGQTALSRAIAAGQTEIVKLLKAAGAK